MLLGAAIASPLAAAVIATVFPPVSVTVAPGLPCPTSEAVERAITSVRGADVAADAPAYRLRVGQAGAGIRADLADAGGTAVWSRSFAAGPSACSSVGEAIALIVERQFREIAWTPPAAVDRDVSSAPPVAADATVMASPDSAAAPAPSRAPPRLLAGAGPALWTRTGDPTIVVELRARLRDALQASLGALLPPSHANVNLGGAGGQVTLTAVPFLMGLGVERPVARALSVQAGAEALLTFERGESTGISLPAAAWRTVLAGGVAAGGAWAISDHLRLDLRLGGYRALLGRSYTVDGVSGNVLEPPTWQAVARVGLGWVIAP